MKKIPLLGDIPGLGRLFRTTKINRDRKELLILLSPQVLSTENTIPGSRSLEDVTREQLSKSRIKEEIKRDALQHVLLDPLFPPNTTNALPSAPAQSSRSKR